jgi:hypothetical protein
MKRIPVLIPVLVFVACLFFGLLVYTYVEAKRANPQMIRSSGSTGARPLPEHAGIDNPGAGCQPALPA